jgi:CO dehydrogenase maturation factor
MKIAVSGKGGVGKTLISGGLARGLVEKGMKTMAIDADSSPNLGLTLGLSVEETRKITPISENKELLESKTNTGYSNIYRLSFTVDDVVRDYAVNTPLGVRLIVMGTVQSMGSGCMCSANAVIRALLRHLIVESNEAVILDMEAGVEHIGRGTAGHVDAFLVVADANMKALEIARHINDLAAKAGMKQVYLVGNRVMNDSQRQAISDFAKQNELPILGFVPFDQRVIEAEMLGETPLKHKEFEAVKAIDNICEALIKKNI